MSLDLDSPARTGIVFDEAPGVTLPQTPGGRAAFLSDVLVELGYTEQATVDEAVDQSRLVGRVPEEILLENEAITAEQLARAIAERHGLAFVDVSAFPIDRGAQELIDGGIALRYRAAPIAFDEDGALVVALADPLDSLALSDIGEITKSEVRPVVATAADMDGLLAAMPARAPRIVAPEAAQAEPGAWSLTQAISSTEPAPSEPEPAPEAEPVQPKPPRRRDDEIPDLDRILGELAAVSGEEPLPAVPAAPVIEPDEPGPTAADAEAEVAEPAPSFEPLPAPEAATEAADAEPAFDPLPPPAPISFTEDEDAAEESEPFMLEPQRERKPLAFTEPEDSDDQPAAPFAPEPDQTEEPEPGAIATPEPLATEEPHMNHFTPEPEPEFESAFMLDPEDIAEIEAEAKLAGEAEVVSLAERADLEPEAIATPEPEPEPKPFAIIERDPVEEPPREPFALSEPEPEPVREPEPFALSEPEPVREPFALREPEPIIEPEPLATVEPEPIIEPEPEPIAVVEPEPVAPVVAPEPLPEPPVAAEPQSSVPAPLQSRIVDLVSAALDDVAVAEVERLEGELSEERAVRARLERELAEERESREELLRAAAEADEKIEALAGRIETLERELAEAREQRDGDKAAHDEELGRLRDRASRASSTSSGLERSLAELEAAIAGARQAADEVVAAQTELDTELNPAD